MPTIFTRIINGELPGRFIYRDEVCVAFLTIEPLSPGHTLVVPIVEVDHWIDLDDDLADHLFSVARMVGLAIDEVYKPEKVGLMIAGLEVPHVHVHVTAINDVHDLDFSRADRNPDPAALDASAARLRAAMAG
jgi:histidine triad (HIT) family protein